MLSSLEWRIEFDRLIARGRQVRRGGGREPEPAQVLGLVHLAGHRLHRRVEVGLRHAHLGIARAHLTEVLVRRDPGRAVGRLEHAEHVADAAPVLHVDAAERLEAGRGEQPRLHVHLAFAVADVAARARRALRRHVAPLVGRARVQPRDSTGGCVRRFAGARGFCGLLRVGHRRELVDLARAVLVERVRGGVGVIDRILPAGRAVVHDHAAGDVAGGLHHLLRRRLRLALRRVREVAHVLRHLRLGRRVRHAARRRCKAIDHLRVGGEAVHVVHRLVAVRAHPDGDHPPGAAGLGLHRLAEQDRARLGGLAELSAARGQRKAQCTQFGLGLLVVARLQRVGGVLEVLLRVLSVAGDRPGCARH